MRHVRIMLAAVITTGCSTTATISRSATAPLEAKVLRSDQQTLFVETSLGKEVVLPRAEVTDVDHPGNVHAIVGGAFLGIGAVSAAVHAPSVCESQDALSCASYFALPALGTGMVAWGLWAWISSRSAAGTW